MRNRQDHRRDFDENDHPRDARGRFVDEEDNYGRDEARGYGSGDHGRRRGEYGSSGSGRGRSTYGEESSQRGSRYSHDYSGSEYGWGLPEEGQGFGGRGRYRHQGDYGYRGYGGEGSRRSFGNEGHGGGRDNEDYGQDGQGSERDDDHDPDYRHWRHEQMKRFDSDYSDRRNERRKKFSEDFDKWRAGRPKDTDQSNKK